MSSVLLGIFDLQFDLGLNDCWISLFLKSSISLSVGSSLAFIFMKSITLRLICVLSFSCLSQLKNSTSSNP